MKSKEDRDNDRADNHSRLIHGQKEGWDGRRASDYLGFELRNDQKVREDFEVAEAAKRGVGKL